MIIGITTLGGSVNVDYLVALCKILFVWIQKQKVEREIKALICFICGWLVGF